MADTRPWVFFVPGEGQAHELSERSKIRIRSALQRIVELRKVTPFTGRGQQPLQLLFAAGIGSRSSTTTLAERMYWFTLEEAVLMGLPEDSFHIIYNRISPKVWGTRLEVKWAFEHARAASTPRMVIVTNTQHAKRCRRILASFEIEPCEFIISDDPPASFLHECLARGMEVAVVLHLEWLFQPLRRKYYRGG